nr:PREDICTED: probable E3 ubiquitin-protein ligase TRIM8 [Struthio camelus australis]
MQFVGGIVSAYAEVFWCNLALVTKMLMKQQDRLEEREQDIEEQLYKLESDKRLVEEKVSQLKDEVRLQYEKMHQILDEDLRKTMEILDKAQAKFCNENAAQVLHLNERMQEAKKLLSSVQVMFDKTEDINFMKVRRAAPARDRKRGWGHGGVGCAGDRRGRSRSGSDWGQRDPHPRVCCPSPFSSLPSVPNRTQNCTGGSLPPPKIGHLNSKLFLNEIAKKEKQLRKLLEGPLSTPVPFLQSIPMYPCTVSNSGAEKRKHSTAFPEGSFLEPSSGTVASQYMSQGASAGEGQSAQAMVPCSSTQHIVGLPSGPQPVHSGSVFNPSHYPNTTSSQQSVLSQYGGRKILVCSVDNCYCSSVSNHSGHQPYPRSGHFPWTVSSQEYSHPLPPAPTVPQSLPGLAVREWIDASQQHGRQDFYRVYGQPSAKHYVTS